MVGAIARSSSIGFVALTLVTPQSCSTTVAGPAVIVTNVSVSGPPTFYELGDTEAFTATVTLSDGTTADETSSATWASSNPAVAAVRSSGAGQVSAVAEGTATITAAVNGFSGSTAVQVVSPVDWQFIGTPTLAQADTTVEAVVVQAGDERTIYVGTTLGLYVTRDGGGSWTQPISTFVPVIVSDPLNASRIYAIAGPRRLVRSTDHGASFQTVMDFPDNITSVTISRRTAGTLYVGFGGYQDPNPSGVFASADDGATWVRHPLGVAGALIVWTIGEDPVNGNLYAGTEIADHPQPYHPPFFRSTNGGASWTDVTGTLPWHVINVAVSGDHSVLALTEGAGLYRSTDGATTWTLLNRAFGLTMTVDPADSTRVFGGDLKNGAFISHDSGAHFVRYGLDGREVSSLYPNGSSTRVYAGCYGSGIYVTTIK